MSSKFDTDDLMALDLEYRLTIAYRINCECAPYFVGRREVLIPEVLRLAAERDDDPVDFFAAFARRVHARHETTSRAEQGAEAEGVRHG